MSRRKSMIYTMVTVAGIVMILISLLVFSIKSNYVSEYTDTTGIITDIVDYSNDPNKHTVTVRYLVDEEVYNNIISYYEESFRDGLNIKIAYNNEDPNTVIYVGDTYRIPILLATIGLIGVMVGVCNIVSARTKGIKHIKNLIVQGKISEVVRVIDEVTGENKGYIAIAMVTNPRTDKIIEVKSGILTNNELKALDLKRNKEVNIKLDLMSNTGEILDINQGVNQE